MNNTVMITPPSTEPVTVSDMKIQLGIGTVTDSTLTSVLDAQISGYIAAARHHCESYTRSVYLTQTWLHKRDHFQRLDGRYVRERPHDFRLPKPPFQSIASFQYVDTTGTLQTLLQDASYGAAPVAPFAYQLDPGSETQPARLSPAVNIHAWPPIRHVQSAVLIQFKCGFGGPVRVAMDVDSEILTGPVFLPGDVGQAVSVPGAGASGGTLETKIAAVDVNGQATLADAAVAAVANMQAWVGKPVPAPIVQAVKFMTQFFYEQGSIADLPTPRVIMALLDPYRNLVA